MKARIEQVDISAGNTDDSSAADTADPKMQITSNVKEPIVVLGVNLSSYSLSQQFLVSCLLFKNGKHFCCSSCSHHIARLLGPA